MPARQEPHGPGRNTSDVDDCLESTIARQVKAEEALHRGDVAPRIEMWSTHDPVTLFGAWGPCKSGWDEASRTFHWVASRFSDLRSYERLLVLTSLAPAGVEGKPGGWAQEARRPVS
jgi:hypothetical protein